MHRRRFVLSVAATGLGAPAIVQAQDRFRTAKATVRLATLSHELEQPWSMAFLPDDPRMDPLRGDARFEKLLQEIEAGR